jgi:ubiquinone/menaquinone biosynthesis C-methylase UbiE
MQRAEIVRLIGKAVEPDDAAWADFGSGDGAFTLALRALLGPHADLYSVDADAARLRRQRKAFQAEAPASAPPALFAWRPGRRGAAPAGASRTPAIERTHFIEADFTEPLDLPPLDGLLLANSLHFVESQLALLQRVRRYLKPSGRLLIVEYDMDRASMWVPYPLPYERLATLVATASGYEDLERIATTPTRYGGRMYAALARVPPP